MAKNRRYYKLIDSRRWQGMRAFQLANSPLCEECNKCGRLRMATVVHHRQPVETGVTFAEMKYLAYNPANLESLCVECHNEIHNLMGSHNISRNREIVRRRNEEQANAILSMFE